MARNTITAFGQDYNNCLWPEKASVLGPRKTTFGQEYRPLAKRCTFKFMLTLDFWGLHVAGALHRLHGRLSICRNHGVLGHWRNRDSRGWPRKIAEPHKLWRFPDGHLGLRRRRSKAGVTRGHTGERANCAAEPRSIRWGVGLSISSDARCYRAAPPRGSLIECLASCNKRQAVQTHVA